MMNRTTRIAAAIAMAGTIAVAAATPSEARGGRIAAGIVGLAAGAAIGAAAANAGGYYYGDPYASGYAYDPGYAYAPDYAYEPGYAYAPAPHYYRRNSMDTCVVEGAYRPDYSNC